MGYLKTSNQKSPRLRGQTGDFWNTQFTICILFWKDDSNLPKDMNVNRHLMKMACIDILSGLFRTQKIKVDLLEEIAPQTNTFRVISLNLSYPQSRHLHPYCSLQASIKTRCTNQIPDIKDKLGNSHTCIQQRNSPYSLWHCWWASWLRRAPLCMELRPKPHRLAGINFLKATISITKCEKS